MRFRFLLLLPFALTVLASEPPRLEILPVGIQNLGSIGPREKRTLAYTFHNRSAAPIALKVADLPAGLRVNGPALERSIAPNQTLALELQLDPTEQRGWYRRRVKLVTDDPQQGDYLLPLEATIRPDLAVDALRLTMPPVHLHESPEAIFHFARETGEPLSLRLISPLPPHLEADIQVQGPKAQLRLVLRPGKLAPAVVKGLETLKVETNVGEQQAFTLYLNWSVVPLLEVDPLRLLFQEQDTQTLKLRRPDGKPFALEEARIEGDGFLLPEALDSRPGESRQLLVKRKARGESHALLLLKVKGEEEIQRIPLVSLP